MSETDELIVAREGSAGLIRLNRPKAINALTLDMVHGISEALERFANDDAVSVVILEGAGDRGLCAGGDIRGLYDSARSGSDLGPRFWRDEYVLNAHIATYEKPYVAYMDGIVMGGGVGLAGHARHRIVTERTRLAMPEVGIGFFPDVGGTWLLAKAPGEIGTYFGLTGEPMNGGDALATNFADCFIATPDWPKAHAELCDIGICGGESDVRAVLTAHASEASAAPVFAKRADIDRLFAHDSMADIFEALASDDSDFARATLTTLRTKSPTSMVVTLRLLRLARASSSLEECLSREYTAALQVFVSDDFREGVRAAIIDKDRDPKWTPASLGDVTDTIAAGYFDLRGRRGLTFQS